eukprot:2688789-Pyramimonas_sp.AAC.1
MSNQCRGQGRWCRCPGLKPQDLPQGGAAVWAVAAGPSRDRPEGRGGLGLRRKASSVLCAAGDGPTGRH